MKKMNKKGFTLIEMLAVIAIIAVLVAIIVPAVGSSTLKAKASTDAANLRSVLSAATIEYAEKGDLEDLVVSVPAAKSVTAATVEIYKNGDALEAYYVNNGSYYNITAFSNVAEAIEVNGEVVDEVVALETAPTATNKVWPVETKTEGGN